MRASILLLSSCLNFARPEPDGLALTLVSAPGTVTQGSLVEQRLVLRGGVKRLSTARLSARVIIEDNGVAAGETEIGPDDREWRLECPVPLDENGVTHAYAISGTDSLGRGVSAPEPITVEVSTAGPRIVLFEAEPAQTGAVALRWTVADTFAQAEVAFGTVRRGLPGGAVETVITGLTPGMTVEFTLAVLAANGNRSVAVTQVVVP